LIDPSQHLSEGTTSLLDFLAFLAFLAHLIGLALPTILTLVSIIWLVTRIIESKCASWVWARLTARFRKRV
jgi:hypothetical protein